VIICVAANPSIDKLFEVDRLMPGAIHRPVAFVQVAGGKGLNVARAAAALGGDVAVVALIAGHAGRWIDEALRSDGILRRSLVWADGETRASLSVADRETRSLTEFYENGGPVDPGVWRAFEDGVASVLPGASWIAVSGSLPAGAPRDAYARLVRMAKDVGVPCALDAGGEPLRTALRAGPDLVKVNAAEARSVLDVERGGVGSSGVADAANLAWTLRDSAGGIGHVAVVTLGSDGAVMAASDGSAWAASVPALGPYPVGSGDAFLAGMVVELDRGGEWPTALTAGVAAAAANAHVAGAGRLVAERAALLAGVVDLHRL
jgi:1-phosphofructokinase family hexose kinase